MITLCAHSGLSRQRGAAFIVMLVILIMGVAAFLVSSLSSIALQAKRDEVTANALKQAKEALIGYAASVVITNPSAASPRPGNLPCPDINNDGSAEPSCSGNAIGRLPWKTLGLPDLRDSNGERLWYAVSINFKKSPVTPCTAPGQSGCLNSNSSGTITVHASDGSLLNDGSTNNGAVAVVIAPGEVLIRQGETLPQNRSCSINVDCDSADICTASPPTLTPKCNAANYLDIFNDYLDKINSNLPHTLLNEDNANFANSSASDGFIQGRIKIHDSIHNTDNVIINDQILVITQDNIMQAVQRRVAGEVKQCLSEYANDPQNMGRYPWAVLPGDYPSYLDGVDHLFGRIPDAPFQQTCLSSGGNLSDLGTNKCSDTPTIGMKNNWTGNCNIDSLSGWWFNWKDLVFYGLSDAYKPTIPLVAPACGTCLSVSTPAVLANKNFIVIVAGKALSSPDQTSRASIKTDPSLYLEGGNQNADQSGGYNFIQNTPSATFNDTVIFK